MRTVLSFLVGRPLSFAFGGGDDPFARVAPKLQQAKRIARRRKASQRLARRREQDRARRVRVREEETPEQGEQRLTRERERDRARRAQI